MAYLTVEESPETRYIGKICAKHPELKGLRRKKDYLCPACRMDTQRAKLARAREDWARIIAENEALRKSNVEARLELVRSVIKKD